MNTFEFDGQVPASKSILNRLLILQSFAPSMEIVGDSHAEDVVHMRRALAHLLAGEVADCGAAGTTLRFLALRASRIPGRHRLTGTARLFSRPQNEIAAILGQLGCRAEFSDRGLTIEGEGWRIPASGLRVGRSVSSQFASGVILNAWDLAQDLPIHFAGAAVSDGYLQMTLALVRSAGMSVDATLDGVEIRMGSRSQLRKIESEIDVSSAFAVAALAAVAGRATIRSWPTRSLQPDAVFPEILRAMGCEVVHEPASLRIAKPQGRLRAVNWDLGNSPDLFPVLAVLCAFADGESILFGAPQLVHKESSRITKTAELVRLIGADAETLPDGLKIRPRKISVQAASFDPEEDHRLAMAAAVAKAAGAPISVARPDVVGKSFPEFWSIANGKSACAPL